MEAQSIYIIMAMSSNACVQFYRYECRVGNVSSHAVEGEHFQDILLTNESTIRSVDCYLNHPELEID